MCGRFNVTSDPMTELLMEFVGQPYTGATNYNTAPRQQALIIREEQLGERTLEKAQWWLIPNWVKEESYKYSMFNARSESAAKSPAFRGPFRTRRCIVPVTGFYEWVDRNGQKQPYFVHAPESYGLLFAGLWDRWYNPTTEEPLESFTILTTAVDPALKFLHHRQPVMLDQSDAHAWLQQDTFVDELQNMCRSRLPHPLKAAPVSPYVNNVRNQGDQCVEIVGDTIELAAV